MKSKLKRRIQRIRVIYLLIRIYKMFTDVSQEKNVYKEQYAYGHREILLDYLDLPRSKSFKVILNHGHIYPDEITPVYFQADSRGKPVMQLVWRTDAEAAAKRAGFKATAIGAPGLYAMSNLGQDIDSTKKNLINFSRNHIWSDKTKDVQAILADKKILYMPFHSWEGDVILHDESVIKLLADIPNSRITVCLGYLDFVDPNCRKIYQKFNVELYCAGIRDTSIPESASGGRPDFIYNLLAKIKEHDAVVSNELTTGQFYAACLNKIVGILPARGSWKLASSIWQNQDEFNAVQEKNLKLYPWLYGRICTPKQIQEDLYDALGIEAFKSKEFLIANVPTFDLS